MKDFTCHLSDSAWEKIWLYVNEYSNLHLNHPQEVRRFVEGVFWILRSGSQWRMLPKEYGDWNRVYQRFCRWSDKGIWHKMLYYFAKDADLEYIMVDSTILRAHACAAGAKKKTEKM